MSISKKFVKAYKTKVFLGVLEVFMREYKRNKLYCYSKPNTMDGYLQNDDCHRYTDDVALCYAENIEQATEIFSRLYDKSL